MICTPEVGPDDKLELTEIEYEGAGQEERNYPRADHREAPGGRCSPQPGDHGGGGVSKKLGVTEKNRNEILKEKSF